MWGGIPQQTLLTPAPCVCPHSLGSQGHSWAGQRALAAGHPNAQAQTVGTGSSRQHQGNSTLQWQVLGEDGLQRGAACQPAARYSSLSHDLQEAGVPVPPLAPETPRPCPHLPGHLHPTLEHISCRALAMPLAGTLQWKTWHLRTQVSLSLATKAKSLQGHEQAVETPAEPAPPPCTVPLSHAPLPIPAAAAAGGERREGTGYC